MADDRRSAIVAGLRRDLAEAIYRLAARTLVLELNVERTEGRLDGDTPAQRYQAFLRRLGQSDQQAALLRVYPALDRLVADEAERWHRTSETMFARLTAARDAGEFGASRPTVVAVSGPLGDPHRGGQVVRSVDLADGRRIVYKPRSLRNDAVFEQVLELLADCPGNPGLHIPAFRDNGTWGWQSWVAPDELSDDPGAATRYYRRFGWLLAIAHATLLTDLHHENLVAHGEFPVIVDLETVNHPSLHHVDDGVSTARRSVLETGLLPHIQVMKVRGADVSAVAGGAVDGATVTVRSLAGEGTDETAVESRTMAAPPRHNVPHRRGRRVEVVDHIHDLLGGFEDGYRALLRVGTERLRTLIEDCRIRVIPRNTRSYASALAESLHPSLLTDSLERELYLSHLWGVTGHWPGLAAVAPAEHADLVGHDVPIFEVDPGSRDLFTSTGERIPNVLAVSPAQELARHLSRLGTEDLDHQRRLVEIAVAGATTGRVGPHPRQNPLIISSPEDAAADIARRVVGAAVQGGTGPTWLGVTFTHDRRFGPELVDDHLYAGRAGTALFLAAASVVLDDNASGQMAHEVFADVALRAERADGSRRIGAWEGLTGVAYALAQAADLLDEPRFERVADQLADDVLSGLAAEPANDIVGGLAGIALAALTLGRRQGTARWSEVARRAAGGLARRAVLVDDGAAYWPADQGPALTGFAHGAAGIGAALARVGHEEGETGWVELARAAWGWEDRHFDPGTGRWRDLRELGDGTPDLPMVAWCHGAPGIGYARELGDPGRNEIAVRAAAAAVDEDNSPTRGHGMCHGAFGNEVMARKWGRSLAASSQRVEALLTEIGRTGPACGDPSGVRTDGLMTGIAGIGYALLRLRAPQQVPDVLGLDGAASTPATPGGPA